MPRTPHTAPVRCAQGRPRTPHRFLPDVIVATIALGVFLTLALYQLDLPGLHYDEAREAGLPALQILQGQPVSAQRGATVNVFGREVPLMVQDYIGALQAFLAVPFLAVFGANTIALRLMPVAGAALALVLAGILAGRLYGRHGAWAAMLVLAVQPSFLFWSRQGVFVTSITGLLAVAVPLLLLRGSRTGRAAPFIGAAFLAGLGLYAKLLFVWVLGALAIVALAWLIAGEDWRRIPPRRAVLVAAGSALAFAAAIAPLVLFNLRTGGTFATLGTNLTQSYYGVNNLAFARNLAVRLWNLRSFLDGSSFWYQGATLRNGVAPWVYGLALAALLAGAAWHALPRRRSPLLLPAVAALAMLIPEGSEFGPGFTEFVRPWTFAAAAVCLIVFLATERHAPTRRRMAPLTLLGLIVVQSCFTVSDLFVTHFALMAPLAPLAIGGAADLLTRLPRGGRVPALVLPVLLVLSLAATDLRTSLDYHAALTQTGGLSTHSDAIYRLAGALRDRPGPVVAVDWGFGVQVQFLTAGAVNPIEVFGYTPDADDAFRRRLEPFLDRPGAAFVFHTPQETVFARRAVFDELAAARGGVQWLAGISRRDGGPVFEIVGVGAR